MSKVEQLIQELCPGGVVKLPLEELCEFRNGYTPSKANKEFWEDGDIPWFRMEDIREGGRILSDSKQHITQKAIKGAGLFKANSIILATTATIGEHAMIIADSLANQQFTNLSIRKSLSLKVEPKYLFYYMFLVDEWCKNHVNVSGFASVDMPGLKKLEIPLPPLPIQQEIVRILDTFTEAQANLEQELELRKKQYEYYRNQLLTFDENDSSVKWTTMGEICSMVSVGIATTATHAYADTGIVMLRNQNIKENYLDDTSLLYITEKFEKGFINKRLKENDILITRTGYPGIACLVPKKYANCQTFTTLIARLRSDQNIPPKYICYIINSSIGKNYVNLKKSGAAQQNFGAKELSKMPIPVPPLARQQEIVSILDKFESAIQTLEEELALRKKQYEYYREKLLTFKSN